MLPTPYRQVLRNYTQPCAHSREGVILGCPVVVSLHKDPVPQGQQC
jgi:hypothetical protein